MVLRELHDFVVVDTIGGGSGGGANNTVQLMMSNTYMLPISSSVSHSTTAILDVLYELSS